MRRRCKQARMQSLCTCFLPDFLPGYARLLRFSPFCCYLERNSSDFSTLCFCSEPAKPGSPPSRGCVATGFRRKSAKPGSLARGAVPCRLFGMLMLDPCCAAGHAAAKRGQSELDAATLRSSCSTSTLTKAFRSATIRYSPLQGFQDGLAAFHGSGSESFSGPVRCFSCDGSESR